MVVATEPGREAPGRAEESAMSAEPTRADGADPYQQTASFGAEAGAPDGRTPAFSPDPPARVAPPETSVGTDAQTRAFGSAVDPAFTRAVESSPDYIPHTIADPTDVPLPPTPAPWTDRPTEPSPPSHAHAFPTEDSGPRMPNGSGRPGPGGSGSGSALRSADAWGTVETSGQFEPGQLIFNRYIVQKKLGAGGMGDVWLVTHRELNADRALKVIVSRISYDSQARARFKREAQVMASFHHPNAVVVHDARLTEQDVAYIDMEFVRGRPLSDVLRKGVPMPLDWIARVIDQLCDVLQLAHQHNIVHRDLKPANLMLVEGHEPGREQLKVLDFGIAKILADGEAPTEVGMTGTGVFLGTPYYASPEQAEGAADTRTDIYAVGVMLYEFLTGFRPFTGSAARILVDVMTVPPPPFAQSNPDVHYPPEIEALVMRCLAKTPEGRPQTAREVAEAFRAALPKPKPSIAEEETSPERRIRLWPFRVEIRIQLAVQIAIACSFLLFAVVAFYRPLFSASDRGSLSPDAVGSATSHGGTGPLAKKPAHLLPHGFAVAPKSEHDELGRPKTLTAIGEAESLGMRFAVLKGRTFAMGEPKSSHEETVGDFAIGETEVTNGQMHAYFKAMGTKPPKEFEDAYQALLEFILPEEAENHPAVNLPRSTMVEFAHWVGGDLPTEAQWEFAARSGGMGDRYYVWPDTIPPQKPLKANSGRTNLDAAEFQETTTTAVRGFAKDRTDQDVFDMMGNVREWCRDLGRRPGEFKVRGGSYKTKARDYSNFARDFLSETEIAPDLGFRVVVEMPPVPTPE